MAVLVASVISRYGVSRTHSPCAAAKTCPARCYMHSHLRCSTGVTLPAMVWRTLVRWRQPAIRRCASAQVHGTWLPRFVWRRKFSTLSIVPSCSPRIRALLFLLHSTVCFACLLYACLLRVPIAVLCYANGLRWAFVDCITSTQVCHAARYRAGHYSCVRSDRDNVVPCWLAGDVADPTCGVASYLPSYEQHAAVAFASTFGRTYCLCVLGGYLL